jgi:hypothetical protein
MKEWIFIDAQEKQLFEHHDDCTKLNAKNKILGGIWKSLQKISE